MHLDWSTLALQTINVLILVWILARFLFRPLRAIVTARQAKVDALLADADAAKRQAAESKTAAGQARADIERQRDALVAAAQEEAAKEKARLLGEVKQEIANLRAEAKAAAARDKAAMEQALIVRIKTLAIEIARRLTARLAPDAGLDSFVAGLCAEFEKLPAAARADFLSEGAGEPIEVVTAAPLSATTNARLREKLEGLLGNGHGFAFRADPAVIAGIELNGRTASLRNSLREDLERIARELEFGA